MAKAEVMSVQFTTSFYTGNWFRSARQKCRHKVLASVSEALALMVRKKSLGENSGSVSPTKNVRFCHACILYSVNSCVFLLEFLLIIKNQRPSKGQKIKCIEVHFLLCIYTLMAGSREFIAWLLQRTERRSKNHMFWAICNAGGILVSFFIQFVT